MPIRIFHPLSPGTVLFLHLFILAQSLFHPKYSSFHPLYFILSSFHLGYNHYFILIISSFHPFILGTYNIFHPFIFSSLVHQIFHPICFILSSFHPVTTLYYFILHPVYFILHPPKKLQWIFFHPSFCLTSY